MKQTEVFFSPLTKEIDVSKFDCGVKELNRFLWLRAIVEENRGLNRTTLALKKDKQIVGFYSLSVAEIARDELPKKESRGMPYQSVPSILIGRLAVDQKAQMQGVGKKLLRHALKKILKLSDEIGCRYVFVDAKNELAFQFYKKYGFFPLREDSFRLVLKLSVLKNL